MTLNEILSSFKDVRNSGNGYMALCPAHDDHTPSLSLRLTDDGKQILLHCFAGCSEDSILKSVGLTKSDLYAEPLQAKSEPVAEYEYYSADNRLLYRKTRMENAAGKSFCFFQPDGTKGVKGIQRVPYNLPAVMEAETIYFVEGEKCADAVIQAGHVATTLDSGAKSKWQSEYNQYFNNKSVIIIPDNDKPGMSYAQMIHENIPGSKIVRLPGLAEKEDIFEWLKSGHTMQEIDNLPCDTSSLPISGTQAEVILNLVEAAEAVFFHNQNNDPYAAVPVNGHTEIWALDGSELPLWFQKLYYVETKKPAKPESIKQVLAVLSAKARYEGGDTVPLSTRVAEHNGSFWYDLTNADWQAVNITADGWQVADNFPLLFNRYRHQSAQVVPTSTGDIRKILEYINLKENHTLFLCWLVCCFIPGIPHVMPIFYGEKGAAKSTACQILKRTIDPSSLGVLTLVRDSRTLVINLQQHWFLPFDNVSHINDEISDTLCRAITGGSIQQRKLFTNAEDYIFTFQRCLAVNGINNVADRSDLLDRSILIELQRIPEEERRELSAILAEFEQDLPLILGGIFDTLSQAMAIYPTVKLDKLPRMADFARWGYAVAEALGGYGNQFLTEYSANRDAQNLEALQSDVVGELILFFMADRSTWTGRVCELLAFLTELAPLYGINPRANGFPTQPNSLGRRLNNLKSNLEGVGISFSKRELTKGVEITLVKRESSPVPPYHLSIGGNGDNGDKIPNVMKKEENTNENE